MDWTSTDFFRPFVNAWIGKLETAYRSEARTHWREVANECKIFYARSCASLWNSRYAARFLNNVIERPRFPISINKAFELVAVVGPNILWQVPYRKVAPKRRHSDWHNRIHLSTAPLESHPHHSRARPRWSFP